MSAKFNGSWSEEKEFVTKVVFLNHAFIQWGRNWKPVTCWVISTLLYIQFCTSKFNQEPFSSPMEWSCGTRKMGESGIADEYVGGVRIIFTMALNDKADWLQKLAHHGFILFSGRVKLCTYFYYLLIPFDMYPFCLTRTKLLLNFHFTKYFMLVLHSLASKTCPGPI